MEAAALRRANARLTSELETAEERMREQQAEAAHLHAALAGMEAAEHERQVAAGMLLPHDPATAPGATLAGLLSSMMAASRQQVESGIMNFRHRLSLFTLKLQSGGAHEALLTTKRRNFNSSCWILHVKSQSCGWSEVARDASADVGAGLEQERRRHQALVARLLHRAEAAEAQLRQAGAAQPQQQRDSRPAAGATSAGAQVHAVAGRSSS